MKEGMATVVLAVCGIIGAAFLSYHLYAYFGPRYEATRREIIEESKAFRDGAIRNVRDYEVRYRSATAADVKAAIRTAVLHELNSFPEHQLPSDLRAFVNELRTQP